LAAHPEHGQTFAEYLQAQPNRPTSARHTLYILPIGPFTETQWHVLSISAEFLSHYFRLPVKVLPQRSLNELPPRSGRDHFGDFQLHTGTLLSRVLWPSLPSDAAALLGLTAIDLYPEASWNFVFGEATFTARVGVWSLARFGNPDFDPTFLRKVLRRTLSTATHETGHMFGMAHCTKHHCNMNGANSLEEADRTRLTLCAECLAKLTWLTAARAVSWLDDIERFLHAHQLDEDAAQFGALHKALTPEDSRLKTGASGS
jgi:archaemetzincin